MWVLVFHAAWLPSLLRSHLSILPSSVLSSPILNSKSSSHYSNKTDLLFIHFSKDFCHSHNVSVSHFTKWNLRKTATPNKRQFLSKEEYCTNVTITYLSLHYIQDCQCLLSWEGPDVSYLYAYYYYCTIFTPATTTNWPYEILTLHLILDRSLRPKLISTSQD